MLELLAYLRANDFKTYIVSGGGIEFVRTFSEALYGIPPEQVIGSSIVTKYEVRGGRPVLVKEPKLDFIDDHEGKPLGINRFIGRRPIAAFGNSDGDFQMLEWVTAGPGERLGLIVHHDDGEREFAYDRASAAGKLDRGLDESARRGWALVSMKKDWKRVFKFKVRPYSSGLVDTLEEGAVPIGLYALAMIFHFLTVSHGLHREYGTLYDRKGAWLLAVCSLVGWASGMFVDFPKPIVAILLGLVAGGVIVNTLIGELPREKEGRFFPFVFGAFFYTVLLLISV